MSSVLFGTMSENLTLRPWPIWRLAAALVVVFSLWFREQSSLLTTQNAFSEPLCLAIFGLFLLRLVVAKIRAEKGRDWIVYLVLVIAFVLAIEWYARTFIPLRFLPDGLR